MQRLSENYSENVKYFDRTFRVDENFDVLQKKVVFFVKKLLIFMKRRAII